MDHEARPERVLEVAVRLQLSAYDAWYLAAAESAWETSFLAGQAFGPYRRAGGSGPRMLAGFLIGAHAAVAGFPLITRTHGYKQYFAVEVVDPNWVVRGVYPSATEHRGIIGRPELHTTLLC